MKLKAICCDVLYREMCAAAARSVNCVDLEFLPKGLHDLGAEKMQARLQDFKSKKDKNVDELLEKVISFEPPKEKNKKFFRNKNEGFSDRNDNRPRRGGRWMDDDEFYEE